MSRDRQVAPPPPEPLRVPAVDSHCHLDILRDMLGTAVEDALAAARASGIDRVVQVGTDLESSHWSARTAAEHDEVVATVAVHPNEAAESATDEVLAEIERLASLPHVRAIGETGLDHYRTPPERWAAQEDAFRRHVDIAKRTGRALVIHDRDAHDDVLRVLREEGPPERVVFHCFSGDAEMAKVCVNAGYVLSFAGTVTFRNAQHLRDALAVAPLDLVMVETDAPFLTPMPYRGRPNGPYLVPLTVRCVAEVKGVHEDEVAAAVSATADRVFGSWPR
jgi:TatD DNase family protein